MLRINEWRDINGFDYQKNTKQDWKVLLPLLPAVKGQSVLTCHIKKLLFAFITSSFTWTSFFLTKAAVTMYKILGSQNKNLPYDLYWLSVLKQPQNLITLFQPQTQSFWMAKALCASRKRTRTLCKDFAQQSTTPLDKLFLSNCIIRKLHLISSLNWSSFSFQPWESP